MRTELTRRTFVTGAPITGVCALLAIDCNAATTEPERAAPAQDAVYVGFPSQDAALVRETVATSHGNFKRVRELVEGSPALAKANWDWGFGDWESALGAAAHTGNRDIAEFLIAHGARPSLFSAAMLGQVEVIKSWVAASPGVQRIHGPHGIPLLAHARAGGEAAVQVVDYLESLGDAGRGYETRSLTETEQLAYVGVFTFGPGMNDHLEIYIHPRNKVLMVKRSGAAFGRTLFYLGGHEFHPAGAPSVRVRFAGEEGQIAEVSIHDRVELVRARRSK